MRFAAFLGILILMGTLIPSQTIGEENPDPILVFTNVLVSTDEMNYLHQVEPTMTLGDQGEVFIGFKNAYTFDGGGERVSYVFSDDDGETFFPPVEMPYFNTSDLSIQSDPWMHYFNNTLYFLYLEAGYEYSQMTMATSNTYGSSWNLVSATNASGFADKETFAIDSDGTIYLAYDDIVSNVLVKLSTSVDGGDSFNDTTLVLNGSYVGPYILPDRSNDNLYLAVTYLGDTPEKSEIFFTRSEDNGKTWKDPVDINSASNGSWFTRGSSGRPAVVSLAAMEQDSTGRIWLAWEDTSANTTYGGYDFNVWLSYSDDYGDTWSSRIMVNKFTEDKQWMPDIEIDSVGNVHLAYYDQSSVDTYSVKYRVLNTTSMTFGDEIIVSQTPTSSEFTRPGDYLTLKLDSDDVPHIVWSDGRDGEMDVYFGKLVESTALSTTSTSTTTPTSSISSTSQATPSSSEENLLDFSSIAMVALPIILLGVRRRFYSHRDE